MTVPFYYIPDPKSRFQCSRLTKSGARCRHDAPYMVGTKAYCGTHLPGGYSKEKIKGREAKKVYNKSTKTWNASDPFYLTPKWRNLTAEVVQAANQTCFYCGGKGWIADHIIPRKEGGEDVLTNLACCCAKCNQIAGNKVFLNVEEKRNLILSRRRAEGYPIRPHLPPLPHPPHYEKAKEDEEKLYSGKKAFREPRPSARNGIREKLKALRALDKLEEKS